MNNETKSKDYYKDLKEDFLKSVKELEEKVNNIKTSDEYIKWLEKLGTVNQYSINNIEYLFKQNPSISYVASFNTWKKYGRSIKKGEKALKVFAPILKDINKVLENEGIISNEENNGEKDVRIVGFRTVNVFDISQTEGKPFDPQIIILMIVNIVFEYFKALRYSI